MAHPANPARCAPRSRVMLARSLLRWRIDVSRARSAPRGKRSSLVPPSGSHVPRLTSQVDSTENPVPRLLRRLSRPRSPAPPAPAPNMRVGRK